MSELDNLLDATLDDLSDLPEFKPFPAGAHRILATLDLKMIGDRQGVELKMKALETLELADVAAIPLKEGDETSTVFFLDNEYGQGNLKMVGIPIGIALGVNKLRDVIEQTTDIECVVITTLTAAKNDPNKFYTNVKELDVV